MDGGEVDFEKVEKEQKLSINDITLLGEEFKDFVTTVHKLTSLKMEEGVKNAKLFVTGKVEMV